MFFGQPRGDKADFRRVRNIAHRLKIHQLWSYQGGILQRIAGDLYTLDGAVEAGNRCNIVKNVNQLSFIDPGITLYKNDLILNEVTWLTEEE